MNILSPIRHGEKAERLSPLGQEPGRLWSLWGLMFSFAATRILQIVFEIGITKANYRLVTKNLPVPKIVKEENSASWVELESDLSAVGFDLSAMQACRIRELYGKPNLGSAEVVASLNALYDRIIDESSKTEFFCLSDEYRKFYDPKKAFFGDQVATNFSSSAYEVQEAATCLACLRSTASAFHSLRCLEAGIAALSRCLSIPDPTRGSERSWAKLLGALKIEMDKRWPPAARLSGDGRIFEEAYAALAAMQNPWRNATMHLDQKYTPEEARHIFEIVGGFMKKLASRMDEQGEPKA